MKCPKCHAQIQEGARFCLYCMTSLEEKQTIQTPKENNKRWLMILAAVLALALFASGAFLLLEKGGGNAGGGTPSGAPSVGGGDGTSHITASLSSQPDSSADGTTTSCPQDETSQGGETSVPQSSSQLPTTSLNGGVTPEDPEDDSAEDPEDVTDSSTSVPPAVQNAVYLYRDAVPADDYAGSASVTNNAVVITGVKTPAANGIYEIPETIGGKKVVAIMNDAFCADSVKDTVKQVIIPANVKTINGHAFFECYNLTDIYIKGNAVACPSAIIPEKGDRNFEITIHASAGCHDRNFHTYKTLCTYWETDFEEWNG